jgi:hypothetical protein
MLWLVAWIVVGYAVLVVAAAVVGMVLRASRPRWLDQMAWLLEALVAVLAIGVGSAWAQGRQPSSPETLGGYLAASVVVVPVAMGTIREDRTSWSSGVLAVAAAGLAVIAIRMMVVR